MKKYIISLILLTITILPIKSNALTYVSDTSHESQNLPYYVNLFNNYNDSVYQKALTIINNTLKTNPTYKFVVAKEYGIYNRDNNKLVVFLVGDNANISYTYNKNWSFYLNEIKSSMTVSSSTTSTTYNGSSSNSQKTLFYYKKGYGVPSYTGSSFYYSDYDFDIVYSNIDLKLTGDNIYNEKMLLKMNLYGTPYTITSDNNNSELYSKISFSDYDKGTVQRLASGDNFYTADLSGTLYTFSSNSYKNVTIDIDKLEVGESVKIQFKTDNALVKPPVLYHISNGKEVRNGEFEYQYTEFFPETKVYTLTRTENMTSFRIKLDLTTASQTFQLIYSGEDEPTIAYDKSNFDIKYDEDIDNPGGNTDNGSWFNRTQDYFDSLGDMDIMEKLNPIYWLKGIGMIFVDLLVPTNVSNMFEEVYNAIYERFPIINDLKTIITQVFDESLINEPESAPKITIDLTKLNIGLGVITLIDFSMFDDFISYIRVFIVSFMVLELVFWYYKKIGGLF